MTFRLGIKPGGGIRVAARITDEGKLATTIGHWPSRTHAIRGARSL